MSARSHSVRLFRGLWRATLVGLSAIGVAACDGTLATGDFRGTALFSLTGQVHLGDTAAALPGVPAATRVALFWNGEAGWPTSDRDAFVTQEGVVGSAFPAHYELALYLPPPAAVVQPLGDDDAALALLLLYVDYDGNGVWDRAAEPTLGGAPGVALAWRRTSGCALVQVVAPCGAADALAAFALRDVAPDAVDLVVTADLAAIIPDVNCDGHRLDWQVPCGLARAFGAEGKAAECERAAAGAAQADKRAERCAWWVDELAQASDPTRRDDLIAGYADCIAHPSQDAPGKPADADPCHGLRQAALSMGGSKNAAAMWAAWEECVADADGAASTDERDPHDGAQPAAPRGQSDAAGPPA